MRREATQLAYVGAEVEVVIVSCLVCAWVNLLFLWGVGGGETKLVMWCCAWAC